MKKQIVKEKIFEKDYDGIIAGFRFADLPKDILPTDIIDIEKCERHYEENNGWEDHSILSVYREREETDFEFEKRKQFWIKKQSESRAEREKPYEKLKKEFE